MSIQKNNCFPVTRWLILAVLLGCGYDDTAQVLSRLEFTPVKPPFQVGREVRAQLKWAKDQRENKDINSIIFVNELRDTAWRYHAGLFDSTSQYLLGITDVPGLYHLHLQGNRDSAVNHRYLEDYGWYNLFVHPADTSQGQSLNTTTDLALTPIEPAPRDTTLDAHVDTLIGRLIDRMNIDTINARLDSVVGQEANPGYDTLHPQNRTLAFVLSYCPDSIAPMTVVTIIIDTANRSDTQRLTASQLQEIVILKFEDLLLNTTARSIDTISLTIPQKQLVKARIEGLKKNMYNIYSNGYLRAIFMQKKSIDIAKTIRNYYCYRSSFFFHQIVLLLQLPLTNGPPGGEDSRSND